MKLKWLDNPVFYTPGEIFSILDSSGWGGALLPALVPPDLGCRRPRASILIFGFLSSWLYMRVAQPGSWLRRLNLLALASGFDLLENFSQAVLIVAYPSRPAWLAWLKTIFTLSKYGFGIIIILFLLIGLALAVRNKFKVQGCQCKIEMSPFVQSRDVPFAKG